jgi:hypothetical protein
MASNTCYAIGAFFRSHCCSIAAFFKESLLGCAAQAKANNLAPKHQAKAKTAVEKKAGPPLSDHMCAAGLGVDNQHALP